MLGDTHVGVVELQHDFCLPQHPRQLLWLTVDDLDRNVLAVPPALEHAPIAAKAQQHTWGGREQGCGEQQQAEKRRTRARGEWEKAGMRCSTDALPLHHDRRHVVLCSSVTAAPLAQLTQLQPIPSKRAAYAADGAGCLRLLQPPATDILLAAPAWTLEPAHSAEVCCCCSVQEAAAASCIGLGSTCMLALAAPAA